MKVCNWCKFSYFKYGASDEWWCRFAKIRKIYSPPIYEEWDGKIPRPNWCQKDGENENIS